MSAEAVAERWMAEKTALDALLSYANEATQAGDADIGEAIRTLVDGYGKGGDSPVPTIDGHKVYFGEITPTEVGGFTIEIPFKTEKIYFGAIWLSDYDLALNHSTENIMLASTWRNYTEAYASIYYMMSGRRDATYKSSYGFRCNSINPNTVRVGYTSYANWPMQTEKYYYMFVYDGDGDGAIPNGLVFEQSVYRQTEGHTITVPLPDGFDLDALLEKNVAIAIYDDGTTPLSGTRNSQIMTVYGFVQKDIFGWSDWESNTRHPVQKAQFQGTDGGQLANWTNHAVYSGLSHQTAKVTTNKFYNGEMYGGLNFTREATNQSKFNIYWGRGNSSYGFMPGHTYIVKLYAFD